MVWLKAALTRDRVAEALDEAGHSASPFSIATIVTDVFGKLFDLNFVVRVYFIQKLVSWT